MVTGPYTGRGTRGPGRAGLPPPRAAPRHPHHRRRAYQKPPEAAGTVAARGTARCWDELRPGSRPDRSTQTKTVNTQTQVDRCTRTHLPATPETHTVGWTPKKRPPATAHTSPRPTRRHGPRIATGRALPLGAAQRPSSRRRRLGGQRKAALEFQGWGTDRSRALGLRFEGLGHGHRGPPHPDTCSRTPSPRARGRARRGPRGARKHLPGPRQWPLGLRGPAASLSPMSSIFCSFSLSLLRLFSSVLPSCNRDVNSKHMATSSQAM